MLSMVAQCVNTYYARTYILWIGLLNKEIHALYVYPQPPTRPHTLLRHFIYGGDGYRNETTLA